MRTVLVRALVPLMLAPALVFLAPLAVPSTTTPAGAAAAYRVLITGDSITQGSAGDYTWRYRLWNKLSSTAPGQVAFTGTRTDLYDTVNQRHGSQAYAASFAAKEHAAVWGGAYRDQLGSIAGQVTSSGANVLVVMLGSNDLAYLTSPAETIANVRTYVERARAARPGLDVVVGEVLNRYDPWSGQYQVTAQVNEFATRLATLAGQLDTAAERVVVAPTRSGWDAAEHTWDGTHPNATGEALIAQRVSQGLAKIGIGTASPDVSGARAWAVPGPGVALTSGSEEIRLSWDRTSTGATGMFIEQRLVNADEPWKRLAYAVSGDGWTADLLAAGGTYQYRVVPAKGFSTGVSGPSSTATAGGPVPGSIGSVDTSRGGDSIYGGATARTSWDPSASASGYLLSYRLLHNGTMSWVDLPYPVTQRSWTFEPLLGGRRYQFRVRGSRGYHLGAWRSSTVLRNAGLPGNRAYAALGDSYSSGLGASGDSFGDGCSRMKQGWAFGMQDPWQQSTKLLACAGDRIDGVRAQLPAMAAYFADHAGQPQLITLTVGGNDVGFVDALKACVTDNCTSLEGSLNDRIDGLRNDLADLYGDIKASQPYSDILVGGYPWVVEPGGSSGNVLCDRLSESERLMVTRLSTRLNATIALAAGDAGVWTVGQAVRSSFVGHNACADSSSEDIHAGNLDLGGEMGFIDKKSFHPKDGGQLRYAQVFGTTLVSLAG